MPISPFIPLELSETPFCKVRCCCSKTLISLPSSPFRAPLVTTPSTIDALAAPSTIPNDLFTAAWNFSPVRPLPTAAAYNAPVFFRSTPFPVKVFFKAFSASWYGINLSAYPARFLPRESFHLSMRLVTPSSFLGTSAICLLKPLNMPPNLPTRDLVIRAKSATSSTFESDRNLTTPSIGPDKNPEKALTISNTAADS